jgi:hypothetical protein
MCLVVPAASEYLYTWWSTQRPGLLQPGIGARLASLLPAAVESPETRIALDPALSLQGGAVARRLRAKPCRRCLNPTPVLAALHEFTWSMKPSSTPGADRPGGPARPVPETESFHVAGTFGRLAGGRVSAATGMFALHSPRFLYGMAPAAALLAVYALDAHPEAASASRPLGAAAGFPGGAIHQ